MSLRALRWVVSGCLIAGCSGTSRFPPEGVVPRPRAWLAVINPFAVTDSTGRLLEAPFLGGLNAPRPQLIDIDSDGDDDLFLQETTGRLIFLERDGFEAGRLPRFVVRDRAYQGLDIGEWYRFADFDGDGDFDLLAEQPFSHIRYYRNEGTRAHARFVVGADTLFLVDGKPLFSDRQNIPQLADIDCNGLLDLLVGKVDGTASRFEVVAGSDPVPRFRLVTERFEDISIVAQFGSLHGANTMALADADGDGDLDLFWGDFFERGLLLIQNTGSCQAFNYRSAPIQFPAGSPILTSGYNAPAFGGLDGVGPDDVLVGVLGGAYNPNRTTVGNLFALTRDADGGWTQQTRQAVGTIDVGSESIPALVDWDRDGDLDLLLANKIDPDSLTTSRIYRFENTGTTTQPSFRLRDALPLGIGYHFAPAFGDLDGDGFPDMILGSWGPRLGWYRHTGSTNATFKVVDTALITITRGSNTTPTLGDLDGDGDLDLIIGESSGTLNYYRNDGTVRAPAFVLVSDTWEAIDIGRRSAPFLVDVDRDGDLDLLIGSEIDGVSLYRNEGRPSAARFVRDTAFAIDAPALATPTAADLNGDGQLDLLVGGVGGGVLYYSRSPVP